MLLYVINTCTVYMWFYNLISLGKINNTVAKILWSVRRYIYILNNQSWRVRNRLLKPVHITLSNFEFQRVERISFSSGGIKKPNQITRLRVLFSFTQKQSVVVPNTIFSSAIGLVVIITLKLIAWASHIPSIRN